MSKAGSSELKLGVNGFGRIGKLTVWHHVACKYFHEIVVNVRRLVGTSLEDIAHYVERDSKHGWLSGYPCKKDRIEMKAKGSQMEKATSISAPKLEERYQKVKLREYKVIKVKFSLGITNGLIIEFERRPTVKKSFTKG